MKEQSNKFSLIAIYLRGFAMGVADLIPGVSGGTIAFITGIYPTLVNCIAKLTQTNTLRWLFAFKIKTLAVELNLRFIATLLAGLLTALFTLSELVGYLLDKHSHLLFAFFVGLVLASAVVIARKLAVSKLAIGLLIVSMITTYVIVNSLNVSQLTQVSPLIFFISGMIAICAMILPGISGSYLLLIMGVYPFLIDAIRNREFIELISFAAGCGLGILGFARILNYMLKRYEQLMLFTLVGVMLGALPKLWPWKAGDENLKQILQPNVTPSVFAEQYGDPQILFCALLALVGFGSVILLQIFANKQLQTNK